jgi:hypothetical protein
MDAESLDIKDNTRVVFATCHGRYLILQQLVTWIWLRYQEKIGVIMLGVVLSYCMKDLPPGRIHNRYPPG